MTKTSTKNPYAFNGAPLTRKREANDSLVLSDKKKIQPKNQKHFYIVSYGCM